MPRFIDIITADEKQKINSLIADGTLNETNMPTFVDSFVRAPDRKTAFEHARDNTLVARVHRDITGIDKAFRDPGIGIRAAEKFFEEKGVVRGAGELAWSAVTTPIRAWGGILGGKGLGERPLETLVGAAGVLPVGRAVAGLTSGGLRAGARAAAGAGQATRAATLTGAADDLANLTSSRVWTPTAQALEVADVVVGAEEWPLELAAEGMLEGAAQVGRLTSRRGQQHTADTEATEATAEHDTLTGSQTAPTPPADPTQPSREVQQRVLDQLAEEQAAQQDAQQQAQQQIQVSEFQQFATDYAPFYADITQNDEEALQRMQSEFEGGVRDPIQTRYDAIAASIQENNPDITPERLQEETDIVLRSQIGDPWVDQLRGIEPEAPPTPAERLQKMVDAADDMIEGDDDGTPDLRGTQETEPTYEPYEPPDIEMTAEEEAEYLNELESNFVDSMTEWMVQNNPDVDAVEGIVDDALEEGYQMGELAEEDARAIRPGAIAAIRERLPEAIADAEATAAKDAEIDDTIENTIGNVKYKKANYTFTMADGSERAVDGYTVENTGIDFAEIFLTKQGNQWLAIDPNTQMRLAGNETFANREQAVRAAMRSMLFYGEAAYQRTAVEEETAEEPELETQPSEPAPEDVENAKRLQTVEAQLTVLASTLPPPEGRSPYKGVDDYEGLAVGPIFNRARDGIQSALRYIFNQTRRMDPENRAAIEEQVNTVLEAAGLRIVDLTGTPYDTGTAARAFNIDNFDEDTKLVVDRVLLPLVMQGSNALMTGEVIVREETQQQTPESETVPPAETTNDTLEGAILTHLFNTDDPLTAEQLFAFATQTLGKNYNSQEVYDILEVAVNKYLEALNLMNVNVDAEGAIANIEAIQEVESRLPRQADRTADREANQQYSTPFHYAYLVNWVANINANDTVLEPSAGAGNLAWAAKALGAEIHVNDIGKIRYRLLSENFENATNVDATQIDKRLPNVNPTLVVMNPPFSSTQGQKKNTLLGVNMVEAALKTLQPGGRLVAIVNGGRDLTDAMKAGETPGGGPNFDSKQYRKWWTRIVNNYQVRANVHVNGDVYKGMGTSFNTRLLVIDNRLGGEAVYPLRDQDGQLKPEYEVMHKKRVDSITEAVEMLTAIRQMRTNTRQEAPDERTSEDEQPSSEPAREVPPDADRGGRSVPPTESEPRADVRPTQPRTDTADDVLPEADGVDAGDTRESVAPSEPADAPTETTDTDGGATDGGVEVAGDGETTLDTTDTGSDTGRDVGSRDPGDATVRHSRGSGGDVSPQPQPSQDVAEQDGIEDPPDAAKVWVPAADSHIVKGRRVNLQETVSLATINSPDVSNIDINIPSDFLDRYSQAQQKAVRLILRAHQSHIEPEVVGDTEPRQGFYDGDDTGVGKTWIAAGTIIHNQNEGRKKHILVTATQNLIKDFQEAFPIAGGNAESLFNITDTKKKQGVLISTYNTIAGRQGDSTRISEILEWATGQKPPESILNPQTDTELLMFGDLPKTLQLAYNMHQAGETLPTRVTEILERMDQFSVDPANPGDHWTEQYDDILAESDAIRAAEGGTTPAAWAENARLFDGVIVYDESHKMKKSKGRGASSAGIRGTQLARLLPNARVLYMSATGTTEIGNMAYMERLGIWGRNKPFANAEDFIAEMERGGIASQEVVARDLKAKGLFISRSLDFSDVVVRSLVHELPPEQIQTYNELANVWQEIRLYLFNYAQSIKDLAEDVEGGVDTGDVVGRVWGQYYSNQQRFFQAMLDALKMQSVIPDMMAQLDAGKKVTIQIVNTYESNQERQELRAQRAGIDMGEVELSAREILEDYLDEENGILPTYDYEIILDAETGENVLRIITNDTNQTMTLADGTQVPPGAPIPNQERVAKRNELLDLVFGSFLPASPLDQFVQAFKNRGLEIAESTGRKVRYFHNEAGERIKEELAPSRVRADVKKFNENKLFGLAFSKAGATGANYPATDPNHPIVQYVIQVGWQADDFKQGLGRSKRSNEVAPPEIVTTATNMVGELRFQSTAASRAAELGATTRGQAQEGTGLDLFSFDAKYLNTDYGKNALYNLIVDLMNGQTFTVEGEVDKDGNPLVVGWHSGDGITSFLEVTGIEVQIDGRTGRPNTERFPTVNRYMNRVLGAPSIGLQNALYDAFFSRMTDALDEARESGTLDTGIDTLKTESATIEDNYTLYTDPDTGAETYATLIEIEEETDLMDLSGVLAQIALAQRTGKDTAFYLSDDGGVYLDVETSSQTNDSGQVIQRLKRTGPDGRTRYMDSRAAYPEGGGTRYSTLGIAPEDMQTVGEAWEAELAEVPQTRKSNIMLVRGLMIDVWDKINSPIDETTDVYGSDRRQQEQIAARKLIRVVLDDGTNIIGRRFTDRAEFTEMLQAFGKDPGSIAAAKQRVNARSVQQMIDDGHTIVLSNGFTLRRRTRAGQPYLAVETQNVSALEGLVNDRVLQKVRPSGGAMTYVLPQGNINSFLNQYTPVAAVKGSGRIELEYDTDTQSPRGDDDEGGQGGNTPDTTPDTGSDPGTATNNAGAREDPETRSGVSEDTSQVEAQAATRTARPTGNSQQPEPATRRDDESPAETPGTTDEEPTDDPNELLSRLQGATIQQTDNQSGLLTFSLGSQVTAEIKKGNYDNMKSGIVRFYLSDTTPPVEKHYRGKALSPENIVDTLRKDLTVDEVQSAMGQPVTVNGVTYTPDSFQMHTKSGYVEAKGFRVESPDHAYAQLIVHPQYLTNKKGQEQWNTERWQVSDMQTGLAIPQGAGDTRFGAVTNALETLDKVGEAMYKDTVAKLLAERQETPDADTTDTSESGRLQQTQRDAPDSRGTDESDDRVSADEPTTDTDSSSGEPASTTGTGRTYHGATFTESNGTLSITGEEIPESFWNYWHSGGRGRGSAHKKAMKTGGWRYSFQGSGPRVYSFSISVSDFERWKAKNPDDGSDPVEETYSPAPGTSKEQQAIDYLETLRGHVRARVDAGSTPERAIISVRHDLSERVYNEQDVYYAADRLEAHPDYPPESRGEGRPRPDAWIEDRLREGLPEQTQQEMADRAAAVPSEDEIKATVLSKLESGDYTQQDGYHYYMDIEGAGQVDVSLHTVGIATYDIGGLSEMSYKTKIDIRSKEDPTTFKWMTIEMPQALVDKHDTQFLDEFLDAYKDIDNWERLGRRNAFKHTPSGAYVSFKKDGNRYEATFSEFPRLGVKFVRVGGDTLEERLQNALDELKPFMFRFNDLDKITDTLRHETGQEVTTDEAPPDIPATSEPAATEIGSTLLPGESGEEAVSVSPGDTSESEVELIEGMEDVRREVHETLIESLPNPVEEQPGSYTSEQGIDGEMTTINYTVREGHVETQPGLFGHEEPINVPTARIVRFESDVFDPIERNVDLNDADSLIDTGLTSGEIQGYLDTDPDMLAIMLAQQQIKLSDVALSLEVGAALSELGLPDIGEWEKLSPDEQMDQLTAAYDRLIDASDDFALTDQQTKAHQFLHDRMMEAKRKEVGVRGGAPIVQTFETIRAVPNIPDLDVSKKGLNRIPVGSRLQEKVDGVTPKMKLWLERSRREYLSGYKNLDTLGPVGSALRDAAEYALDIQDRGSIIDLRMLEPHQKALVDLARKRTPKGASREVVGAAMSEQIFRFIEENTPIEGDVELLKVAQGWKDAWRKILTRHVAHMLQIRKEIEALPGNERVVIRRSDGSTSKDWSPLLPGHTWVDEQQMFERESDQQLLTPEDAIAQSDRLYMPHNYPTSHWNAIVDQVNVNKIISKLDAAVAKKGNKLPGFTFNQSNNSWTFDRTGDVYPSKQAAADGAKQYWTEQYALAQEQLAGKETSVVGRYGHLELARETTDKLYMRDVSMLLDHSQMFWHRLGEIAVWGQYDPVLGSWPRLAQYIARIGETALSGREKALMTVADILMNHESDMFERLPSFREGEQTAANIMRYWRTPDLEKMRADNPNAFTDEVLDTLVEIGFATENNGVYQLRGESEDARRATFIRHMVPHFQTMHLREETVLKIVRGIGHWENNDELNSNSGRFWSGLNHITTTLTLGLGTSIQNIGEIPLLATVTGSKNVISGIKRLTTDKAFREMLPQLGAALSRARDYLADTDTQSKYLNFVLFTPTEKWSRLTGVAVGWEAAKDAISKYLDNPSKGNRARLEELNISVQAIDNYRSVLPAGEAPAFDALVKEAEGRVLEGAMMMGGLRKPDAPAPSNMHVDWVGDEMARAARYVSTRVFKGYNALSLPSFLTKKDPMIRTFFKFKSWAAQMHQFMWEQFGYARKQAMQGNWAPAWRLAQGFVGMGVSSAMIIAFFNAMAGREDDEKNKVLQSIAQAHTLGVGSMLMEIAIYADGSPYKAAHILNSALGSPTAGVFSRVGAEILSGDVAGAGQTAFWQLPFVREAKRFGGGAAKAIQGE